MKGVISFHPIDTAFFEKIVNPLVAGAQANPDAWLDAACRVRRAHWVTHRFKLPIARLLEDMEPPPPLAEGSVWERLRDRVDRLGHRPPPLARLASSKIEPDIHLRGRPFLITEGSASRVAEIAGDYASAERESELETLVLDQLIRLDKKLASAVEPDEIYELSGDGSYCNELLNDLKNLRTAGDLPWQAVRLHGQAVPYWIADDVDGLETICRAAGVEPPGCLVTASSLFVDRGQGLAAELGEPRAVGAYVPPEEVPALRSFLTQNGARIIRVATRHDEGAVCASVLRKIRECATFAEKNRFGYLEASGIEPDVADPDREAIAVTA